MVLRNVTYIGLGIAVLFVSASLAQSILFFIR